MKEAMFYEKFDKKVKCLLCGRECIIPEGERGFCGVRENIKGKLYSLVYSKPCSLAMDPIEKKPFFHFAPGSFCLSIATVGCNLRCLFCQNWEISQAKEIIGEETEPEKVIELARSHGAKGISYTYTEPTIFYEYALDIMKLAKKQGFYNVWVSNGYINPEPIKKMAKYLDGVNVDLKGDDEFYKKVCLSPGIKPVLTALKTFKKYGIWIEVTNLIVPGYNDSEEKVLELVKWIKTNLGLDTPLHFSRFYPSYKMLNVPPTPKETLEKCVKIAEKQGLHYVYLGNVLGHPKESTYCWKCGTKLIERFGFEIVSFKEKCPNCGNKILIKGKKWMK